MDAEQPSDFDRGLTWAFVSDLYERGLLPEPDLEAVEAFRSQPASVQAEQEARLCYLALRRLVPARGELEPGEEPPDDGEQYVQITAEGLAVLHHLIGESEAVPDVTKAEVLEMLGSTDR